MSLRDMLMGVVAPTGRSKSMREWNARSLAIAKLEVERHARIAEIVHRFDVAGLGGDLNELMELTATSASEIYEQREKEQRVRMGLCPECGERHEAEDCPDDEQEGQGLVS